MKPEAKYKGWASLSYWTYWRPVRARLTSTNTLSARNLIEAVADAKEYLSIGNDEFFDYVERWDETERQLFSARSNENAFYKSWLGQAARYNICANVLNQCLDTVNLHTLYNYFGSLGTRDHVADYGCGTAALSIFAARTGIIKAKLTLLDVENDTNQFVHFLIAKYKLQDRVEFVDASALGSAGSLQGLYCIDVLEHLSNCSALLIDHIDPALALGARLYLKAPWRGHLTHLDEAVDDFYGNGGHKLLASNYRVIYRALPSDIACVYEKRVRR